MKTKKQKRINEGYSKLIVVILFGAILVSGFSVYSPSSAQVTETPEIVSESTENTEVAVPAITEELALEKPAGYVARDIAKMREHIKTNNLGDKFLQKLDEFEKNNVAGIASDEKPKEVVFSEVPRSGNDKHPFKVVGAEKTINKANERDFNLGTIGKKNNVSLKDIFQLPAQNDILYDKNKHENAYDGGKDNVLWQGRHIVCNDSNSR